MRLHFSLPFAVALLGFAAIDPALGAGQKTHHDPLTEAQVEKIREAGIDPNERIKLYTDFLSDHVNTVKSLTNRAKTSARAIRLDRELQDIATLMDELGSNLDTYSDRHADMRPALKNLAESSQRWMTTLRALAGEAPFDLSRKEAIEAGDDIADQAKRLLQEQTYYFNEHKEDKGQERSEPKPQ
jgi:DNA repair ATPase RecN